MTDARKTLKKIGGGKKSPRRNSSRKQKRRELSRWKHILIVFLIVAAAFFAAYHIALKKLFFRFAEKETTQQTITDIYGIDVSRYQGNINWEKLKKNNPQETPIYFTYIKATEGKNIKDPKFKRNWKNSKKAGFIRGAYHYFTETSSGEEQAKAFTSSVKLEKGDLPPMVDVEEIPKNRKKFNKELKIFIKAIERYYDTKPIIYSSPEYKKRYLNDGFYDKYPSWVAHYYVKEPDTERWDIWQFTDKGKIPGIGHDVDINRFNGNLDKLKGMTLK